MFKKNLINTLEITLSKIFPAGMGWQTFSILSNKLEYSNFDTQFYLLTGLGDSLAVMSGHYLYFLTKKKIFDNNICMKKESHNSILYGTAAFMSGTSWQPVVNQLQFYNTDFYPSMFITGLVTGNMFLLGLRFSRTIYPNIFTYIEQKNDDNFKQDLKLSISIAGATGTFLGTDITYKPNIFNTFLGIEDNTNGIINAGLSTSLGFFTLDFLQNKKKTFLIND